MWYLGLFGATCSNTRIVVWKTIIIHDIRGWHVHLCIRYAPFEHISKDPFGLFPPHFLQGTTLVAVPMIDNTHCAIILDSGSIYIDLLWNFSNWYEYISVIWHHDWMHIWRHGCENRGMWPWWERSEEITVDVTQSYNIINANDTLSKGCCAVSLF